MPNLCPICHKPGYLIKEKVRKKNRTQPTNWEVWEKWRKRYPKLKDYEIISKSNGLLYPMNIPHKPYNSEGRTRSRIYKFVHNRIKQPPKFCYIGSLSAAISRIRISNNLIEKYNLNLETWNGVEAMKEKYPESAKAKHEEADNIFSIIEKSKWFENEVRYLNKHRNDIKEEPPRISDPMIN